jgi:hypothetical protein
MEFLMKNATIRKLAAPYLETSFSKLESLRLKTRGNIDIDTGFVENEQDLNLHCTGDN